MRRIAVALAVALPALVLRLSGVHLPPRAAIPVYGSAVVASAFLLVWAAEASIEWQRGGGFHGVDRGLGSHHVPLFLFRVGSSGG